MDVSALLVIITTVVVASSDGRPLLGIGSHKVNTGVGVDLCLLQGGELRSVESQSLVRRQRAVNLASSLSSAV